MSTLARIATVCQAGRCGPTVEKTRSAVMELLDLALGRRPDLVCLPEAFPSAGSGYRRAEDVAEPVPGPTVDAAAERARRHRCYVIVPLLTRREGRIWNSAVVLDRSGGIAGIYDKVQPVTTSADYTELENGVTPGSEYSVFDLDFGKIGIQICFDICFPEGWQQLADKDARIVFWPSAYNGGMPLNVYAALHSYYVVTAVRADGARVIDPCGRVLAETDSLYNVVWQDINTDYLVCHYDFNYSIADRIEARYPGKVQVRSHLADALFLLEPTDPALTTAQLAEEFGIEDKRQYAARHRAAYAQVRQGCRPAPQAAQHGNRPQYAKREG